MWRTKQTTHDGGFTLLETLVALVILALTLTTVYQTIGWTLQRSAQQRHRDRAWLTAQSLLNQLRGESSLKTGRVSGQTPQGERWRSEIEPYVLPSAAGDEYFGPAQPSALQPFQVRIAVSWGPSPSRQVELRSVELGTAK
jgi:general secretion pathway protein I